MITKHALQRAHKRTGLNLESSERFILNAIERGKPACAFAKKEREYLENKEAQNDCWTIVYNSFCFIFSDDGTCLTTYKLPTWFGKVLYDGKEVVRNPKRYTTRYQYN